MIVESMDDCSIIAWTLDSASVDWAYCSSHMDLSTPVCETVWAPG